MISLHDQADSAHEEVEQGEVHTSTFTCLADHYGTTLHAKAWTGRVPGGNNILIVHDVGEDSSFYREAAQKFTMLGFNTYCFDLRGHGRSGSSFGHIEKFNQLISDLLQICAWIKHQSHGQFPLVLGQGFGALIAIFFQARYAHYCPNLVLLSPTIETKILLSPWKRLFIKQMANLIPEIRLPNRLIPKILRTHLSVERSNQLGLRQHHTMRISAKFADQLIGAMDRGPSRFLKLNSQTLIIVPQNDPINSYESIKKLIARHKFSNRFELVEMPTHEHNILLENDANAEVIANEVIGWIKRKNEIS